MIGRLTGTLLEKNPPQILVDAGGVGYELEVPMSTFYGLPATGSRVSLHTHLAIREDGHFLYGFASEEERGAFRQLLKVSGIGARTALAVLSGLSVNDLAQAVALQEAGRLVKIPGIGKKTAERMIVELRDKAADFSGGGSPMAGPLATDPVSEATVALQQLGYKPAEAAKMARDAAAEGDDVATVIRKALQSALR